MESLSAGGDRAPGSGRIAPSVCRTMDLVGFFRRLVRARRVQRTRRWILTLDRAELLALLLQPDTGLDKQDCDGLVQLAFESYPDGHKDAIINRIAEHLN